MLCRCFKKSEAAVSRCSSKKVFLKISNIQRKTPVLESLFDEVAGLQLSYEYCKIFKSSFFHKSSPEAASEKFINLQGKHQWRRSNSIIFLIDMTE